MVKIKKTKKFTQKELVKYLLEQDDVSVEVGNCERHYYASGKKMTTIEPVITGNFDFDFNFKEKSLEMLIEEEITEETVIPTMIEVSTNEQGINTYVDIFLNKSINSIQEEYDVTDTLAFHMVNSDGTLTLLWTKEGGMVE